MRRTIVENCTLTTLGEIARGKTDRLVAELRDSKPAFAFVAPVERSKLSRSVASIAAVWGKQ